MWFTEEGKTGTLEVEMRDDEWFVVSPGDVGETRCVVDDEIEIDDDGGQQRIEGAVKSFRWGVGGNANRLSLTTADRAAAGASSSTATGDSHPRPENSESSDDTWDLKDFTGSGEYVDVEATVDSIHFIKKETRRIPDIRGELVDDSVREPVIFVVEDGVSAPRFDVGKRFRFENVKDHFYKKNAEVQVLVNQYTDFVDLG